MKKGLMILFCLVLLGGLRAEASQYKSVDSGICTEVADHQGVGFGEGFEKNIGTLFCFTRIEGGSPPKAGDKITHVWYHRDAERFRIALPVKGSVWVTHSEKNILPAETGDWRVDVLDPEGDLISVFQFFIKE